MTTQRAMTADELLHLRDEGGRCELVRGELRRMPWADFEHGRLTAKATMPLGLYVRANDLGVVFAAGTGFQIATAPDTVRAPDVAFVSRKRIATGGDPDGYWPGAPDLAAEVVSRNDLYTEIEEKVIEWLDAGARMVVVVNPRKRMVTVYRSRTEIAILDESDTLDGADVVPGWRLPVAAIFA